MRRWIRGLGMGAVACMLAQAALAGGGLTLKLGTLGAGADLSVGLTERLNARLGVNGFSYDIKDVGEETEGDADVVNVQGKLDWQTLEALLDWHPWATGFRLSAGVMANNNKVKLTADVYRSIEINGHEYWMSDLNGTVDFNQMAPYVGIGYGNAADGKDGHWSFACDFGVMFQGSPNVTISATASDPHLQSILDADIEADTKDIEEDMKVFNVYPVISFGVSYSF